jgi:hypothetical protein
MNSHSDRGSVSSRCAPGAGHSQVEPTDGIIFSGAPAMTTLLRPGRARAAAMRRIQSFRIPVKFSQPTIAPVKMSFSKPPRKP